jgi:hypothetical protein
LRRELEEERGEAEKLEKGRESSLERETFAEENDKSTSIILFIKNCLVQ